MFLTHPQQTKDNFKEVIQNLLDDCLDIENKINPELLPKTLRAKEAAWLMVCVQLGGEVDLSNDDLFFLIAKKARRFHNHIHSKYYQRTEGLKFIGCTGVKMNIHSIQDKQSFEAKHQTLLIPANNFKAFYQRIQRLIKS